MRKKTYEDGKQEALKAAWDMFNKRGISIIPDKIGIMNVTISHTKKGALESSITFSRPSEVGILSWLPDKDWQELKDGKIAP